MSDCILQMTNITKTFPGVKALENVTFEVKRGEVHALVGENGAGKSTLMKVLTGIHPTGSYSGKIILNGKVQNFHNIKDSEHAGIAIIYQELALCKNMNVTESIFMGEEIVQKTGFIDWDTSYKRCAELLEKVNLDISPDTKIINLGVGQQQLVEICKAISKEAQLLVLDEPTAALTEGETARLFSIIRELKQQGVTCIYISHKLDEIFELADTITVLRDGQTIITKPKDEMSKSDLISYMVGRQIDMMYPRQEHVQSEVLLEVNNWTVDHPDLNGKKVVENVSFTVHKGEILGIAGLMGAGRTELFMSLIGEFRGQATGSLEIFGKETPPIHSSKQAIEMGLAYVSEDRKRYGLVQDQDVIFNTGMASFDKVSEYGLIQSNKLIQKTKHYVQELKIKTPSIEQYLRNLSGGNQQKVVLAKWLMTNPQVLILDEPTRGIDVGAKVEIYNIMNALVDHGVGIVMISSELPEVLGMSDRILVMHEGKMVKEIDYHEATQENVMYYMTGGK